MDDNHSSWHLKYNKQYPHLKEMKARINVQYATLLTGIQGHENACLSIPTGTVCSWEALWKDRNHGKGTQCLTPQKGCDAQTAAEP